MRCRKEGAAKAGVPQNTIRSGTDRLPLAVFSQLANFALDDVALKHAEMIDEQNAVEMINFVAESTREQAFAAHFKFLSRDIERLHCDVLRTGYVAAETGHRKTAFFFALLAFGVNDLRICADKLRFGI